jgi:hypothetical protein
MGAFTLALPKAKITHWAPLVARRSQVNSVGILRLYRRSKAGHSPAHTYRSTIQARNEVSPLKNPHTAPEYAKTKLSGQADADRSRGVLARSRPRIGAGPERNAGLMIRWHRGCWRGGFAHIQRPILRTGCLSGRREPRAGQPDATSTARSPGHAGSTRACAPGRRPARCRLSRT